MSNVNDFVASVNRLENLIDSNQTDLKRDVDLRFGSLREEVNKLKSSHPSLDKITNLLSLLAEEDNRHNFSDLPDRIRTILSTFTSNNNVHRQTPDLDVSENSANVESVNIIDGNVSSTGATNDGTHVSQSESANEQVYGDSFDPALSSVSTANEHQHTTAIEHGPTTNEDEYHQIDISEGGEVLGCNQNESLPEEPNETNQDISALVPASPSDISVIIKFEASSSPQSVRVCKGWIAEIDGEDLWCCDCGSVECRVKQEIKDEFDETGQFEIHHKDQSSQLGTQVKEEVESGEKNVIGPEGGDELNDNQNESLHEQSNGMTQCSPNDNNSIDHVDQQMDNGDHESSEPTNDECNQSQTSKQSKIRKRKRTGKSLSTKSENLLENSLPNSEVSTPITIPRSKRIRVTSPLETETTDQLSTGSEIDSSEGDDPNDPFREGEKGVEQSEDDESWWDSETELGDEDEDEGGHYRIRTIMLKCTEENCNAEVTSRDEMHRHWRNDHLISSPYRCLARGCFERFETTEGKEGLARHVQQIHWNISTWPCLHCTKTFKFQRQLFLHLYCYHFEGQFKCDYDGCHYDRVATFRSEIKNHQHSVHPKSTIFTCQFNNCGKSFTQKGNLNRHQKSHAGGKPFRCDWIGCGKSFTQKCNLKVHHRVHQGVKPYKCTWNMCDYASTHQSTVIEHIRTKHFHLPRSQTKQRQLEIEDNRNPHDYLLREHINSPI